MNPFRSGIVANPWESAGVDVNTIHRDVFERCLQGIDQVRATGTSEGIVIHGAAGSGKTHLLQRLRAQLTPQAPSSTDRRETLYVWVRLQTSPRMIWRTLRRTLVNDWFRPVRGTNSQFQRILFHRFAEIRTAEGDLERWYDYMLENNQPGLKELLDEIADNLHLDRNTAIAFEHIAFGRHIRDLRAWLSGDSLPEAALARMDLAQDEGTDEEREDESKRIVEMLCNLAGNGLPIVIAFDQVEALEMTPGDRDALFAFGQLTSTLHDRTTNVLFVSCVQSSFLNQLRDHARQADYDRMASLGAWSLHPLDREQSLQLIQARLNQLETVEQTGLPKTGSWPLSSEEFDRLFAGAGTIPPRKLLGLCAERFEIWSNRAAEDPARERGAAVASEFLAPQTDEAVTKFIRDKWATTVDDKHATNTPERTEEIVRHGLPMLVKITAPNFKVVTDERLPDVSLIFEQQAARTGISLCTQANMTSLAGRLKRLKDQLASGRINRLVIIRDSRVPVSAGAKKSQQLLDELEQQKAKVVYPSVEALATLDALRDLLSDAKSGNLSWNGENVSPQTVEDWLVGNLTDELRGFVDDVLAGSPRPSTTSDAHHLRTLNTLLATRPVLALNEAAGQLKVSSNELTALVERHPDQFRLLNGESITLFRAVETTIQKR